MRKPEIPHLTVRLTDERAAKLEQLRGYMQSRRGGVRVHGVLTTAQILDWCMDAVLASYENRVITKSTSNPD